MKKKVLALIMAGTMALSMAACGNTQSQDTPKEPEKQETVQTEGTEAGGATDISGITADSFKPSKDFNVRVPFAAGGSADTIARIIGQGLQETYGKSVIVNNLTGANGAIAAADLDSAKSDATELMVGGIAMFTLAPLFNKDINGDALIGGEGITSIEDLKGKQVAYSSGTSSEDILVNSLTSVGLTMDDIEAIDMDASGIVSAMLSGKVDAAATWSPNSLKILEEDANATKLADNMTFSDKTVSLASWICMPKYAEENRDVLVRFTRALFKAMDYAAADHQEDTAALIAKQIAGDQDTVYDQRGDAEWLTGKEVSEGAADGTVEGYYELQKENFIEAGAVEVDPPVSDYVLLDVMKEAGEY